MSFRFASPWLLGLLILLPILGIYLYGSRSSTRLASLKHTAVYHALDLPVSWKITLRPILKTLRLLAIGLLIFALARPQTVHAREIITGEGVDIALALDISGSMASLDFQPSNRLEAAKAVITNFVSERAYDKIGLVVFASEAFNQSPLTLDRNMLQRSLDRVELASDLGIDDGTAIGLGIANAAHMLSSSESESKVLILLTDGVNNAGEIDPLTAAEAASALDIKIYVIGAAHPGQVPVPVQNIFGGTDIVYAESMIDEDTLRQVAEITDGRYYRAEDTEGLREIYDEINQLEKSEIEVEVFNQYEELAGLILLPALVIFLSELFLNKTVFRKLP
jgi:Ca-activated chloride channel family protein